jgi:hypothetical protein
MRSSDDLARALRRARRWCAGIGATALVACLAGAPFSPDRFFPAWLLGFVFWTGVGFGCFAFLMMHHLTGGRWGFPIRRLLEAGTRTFPIMLLFFVPIAVGLRHLYPWARPEADADALLRHKAAYLNVPFFLGRTVLYFAAMSAIAFFLNRWSLRQDRTAEPALTGKLQRLSGPGLVVWGLTIHWASIDWVMSLEPQWYSTMFGFIFMAAMALSGIAVITALAILLTPYEPFGDLLGPLTFKDLGNFLLLATIFYAYVAFGQFLIIWMGNLKEEVPWYVHRFRGGWAGPILAVVAFHFFVPFFLLLFRWTKRRRGPLFAVVLMLVMARLVDLFWVTHPPSSQELSVHWMDFLAPLGMGGVWMAAFLVQLGRSPLLPLHDPRFEAAGTVRA